MLLQLITARPHRSDKLKSKTRRNSHMGDGHLFIVVLVLGLSLQTLHATSAACGGLKCRCDLARLDAANVTVASLEALRMPVVLEGMAAGWAAFERWELPRFRELYDSAAVAFVASDWASFEGNLTMQDLTRQVRAHHTSPNSLIFSDYPSGFVRQLRGDYTVPSIASA